MESKLELIKEQVKASTDGTTPATDSETTNVGMFIGEALSDDEKINELMTNSKPEVTVLVGFEGYGKTSFISTCYQIILTEGKIGDYICYDSDTLTGLERRLFLRRYNEKLQDQTPQTRRTIRGEAYLLTFRFCHPEKGEKLVVISDHSGEDYREYSDRKGTLEKDVLIQNADRLLFFVDSQEMIGKGFLAMKQRYTNLINNMKEAGVFKKNIKVQVLFNKYDCVGDKEQLFEQKSKTFMEKIVELMELNIDNTFNVVSNHIDNSEALRNLFFDIVNDDIRKEVSSSSNIELDWVKHFIKNH